MVMTAFNAIDRKPISGNKELLKGLLRDKEGFEGTVISDWGSIGQLEEQGVAADMLWQACIDGSFFDYAVGLVAA